MLLLLSKVICFSKTGHALTSYGWHIIQINKEASAKTFCSVNFGNFGTLCYGMFLVVFWGNYSYCQKFHFLNDKFLENLCHLHISYVPVNLKLQHPPSPRQPPGHLNFWNIFCSNLPLPGQMPPHPGKLPDNCFKSHFG